VLLVLLGLVFSVPSQEIGWEERFQNDLFCVEWDVKPCSIHPCTASQNDFCSFYPRSAMLAWVLAMALCLCLCLCLSATSHSSVKMAG